MKLQIHHINLQFNVAISSILTSPCLSAVIQIQHKQPQLSQIYILKAATCSIANVSPGGRAGGRCLQRNAIADGLWQISQNFSRPPTDQHHTDFSSRAINRAHKTNFGNSAKVSVR